MKFNPSINQGEELSNKELSKLFLCGNMGGMRRSHKTNTLVIVSDHTKGLYDDKWYGNIIHYTGMGSTGDQSLSFAQNKTLNESTTNGVGVYLFEVFQRGKYIYQGEVKLVKSPYVEIQPDKNNDPRKVWMFPLKLTIGNPWKFDIEVINKLSLKKDREIKKLNRNQIKLLAERKKAKKTSRRKVLSDSFERDPIIVRYALERAGGFCQLCDQQAPFSKKDGEPFLEVHHIEYLSQGGTDTINNVVALCPNCHRKIHSLEREKDKIKLLLKANQKL